MNIEDLILLKIKKSISYNGHIQNHFLKGYRNAFPAKLIIECGQVRTENSNKPHGFGVLNPSTFTPFPKNPVIGAFFREIHRADELGSGMRNMMKYGKAYGGEDPQMIEGDVFRIIVKIPEYGGLEEQSGKKETGKAIPEVTPEVTGEGGPVEAQSGAQSGAQSKRILWALDQESSSAASLAEKLGLQSKTGSFKRALAELLEKGLVGYTIPEKPTSRLQKYRLTSKGDEVLNALK